jgi:predicted MFS family arabinose efflux permease
MHLSTKHQGILGVALSYESTADEISYVVGPAAVGVLASLFGPVVPMVVAIALTALAVPAFALHPTGKLAVAPAADADPAARSSAGSQPAKTGLLRLIGIVAAPLLGTLGAGLFFGGTQASVTAAAGAAGSPQVSGLMYCVLGFGSAITALALVIVPDRISLTTRWRVLSAGQLLSACLFLAVTGLAPLTAVLALVGLFVGPTMVTVLTIGSDLAPLGREAMTMTLIQSGNVLGVAAGASLAGAIADAAGSRWAFIVPIVACAVLAAAAYIPRRRRDS